MKLRKHNVLSYLEDKTDLYADKVAVGMKTALGWEEFTYSGLGMMSRKIAHYLMNELDVQKGERLAILAESKPEYGACVFASVLSGMVTVPLDIKLTEYELESILTDCEPTVLMASRAYIEKAKKLQEKITSIKTIILMDEPVYNTDLTSIYVLPDKYSCKWRHRSSKSTALIIYTSGTTGSPKGVEISFQNMLAQLDSFDDFIDQIIPRPQVRVLSILPMNHLFEMTIGFSTFLSYGFSVYYAKSLKPKDILSIMREKQIEFMLVVPAFLKLLKAGIENDLSNAPLHVQAMFNFLYHAAKFTPFYCIKKLLFKPIHDKFGGHFAGCIAGGAPLDIEVARFFERIGIRVFQGYGLTETSPVVSVNYDRRHDISSVGRPLKSYEAKIDPETGELLLKGPSVMKGYHNQPEMTAEVLTEDGWLHTGDIATIKKGHLYITGRIKNMIVLSGGKKVFPEEVEAVLEKSPLFAEICVLGVKRTFGAKDGTEEVAVVVVPKDSVMAGKDWKEVEQIVRDEVKKLSVRLTAYKRPVNVTVTKEPLPRTTTRKVKRKEVKELVKA
ncbi:MAG: AMP-binding protein [bacterium]|nr:AMP-binding protein [bacterium]